MKYANTKVETITTPQGVFDAFNSFIFSDDLRILAKLLARHDLMKSVAQVPGDIVEMGVFKGSGLASFLKMKKIMFPEVAIKKVIGFDYFDSAALVASLSGVDRDRMAALFKDRKFQHEADAQSLVEGVLSDAGFVSGRDFELVGGDIAESVTAFLDGRPGFRCSLLYIDVDVEGPTLAALEAMWDRIPRGGIVAFDDYGIHQWSEANAADRFFAEKGLSIFSIDAPCPTAYVRK